MKMTFGRRTSLLAIVVSSFTRTLRSGYWRASPPSYLHLDWLTSPAYALPSVAAVSVWRHAGYTMLICLAGLKSIPESLYEAARMDGASRFA
jgi:ABC-type sugar transport system permease subunit